jgi:hypothetical protein
VEIAKEEFFIGSVLGILAFLNTLIHPAFADNRQKWEALKERLTEEDLIDLQYEVYVSRKVRDELLYKVRRVVHDIEQDAESVRFGPRFRGLFRLHKDDLSRTHLINTQPDTEDVLSESIRPQKGRQNAARSACMSRSNFLLPYL